MRALLNFWAVVILFLCVRARIVHKRVSVVEIQSASSAESSCIIKKRIRNVKENYVNLWLVLY